jgi:ribosomal protein S27E
MISSQKTVHENDLKPKIVKNKENTCQECGAPKAFTIIPTGIKGFSYIKDIENSYDLCHDCFEDFVALKCGGCGAEEEGDIIFDYSVPLKYCKKCGLVLGRPNTKSHNEKKDYDIKASDYKL